MSTAAELHAQIASIVEVLANSAVAEICKAVEDGYAVVNLEMSRNLKENECLRRRVRLLELQVSRYRAEQRLKPPLEGAASGRAFPAVRLLHHRTGRDTPTGTGSSLQNRSRFLNKSFVSQPQQKTAPTDLDQDPDQDVVTTTKTEPAESEENSDLVIVKVEGSVSIDGPSISNIHSSSAPTIRASDSQAQTGSQTEVSGSQPFTRTQDGTRQTKIHNKNPSRAMDSDVIVIDGTFDKEKDVTSERVSSNRQNYADKTWISFQTPPHLAASTVSETVGISSFAPSAARFDPGAVNLHPNVAPRNAASSFQPPASFQSNAKLSSRPFGGGPASAQGGFSDFSVRQFACSKCPMRFSLEAELAKHVAGHKTRKYLCGLCGKGFISKSQLEIHQNVHTGERPFKCTVCNGVFSHPSNLRRHMRLQHQQ